MSQAPTAFALFRVGLARILDVAGVVLLPWLGFQVMFGGSQPFEAEALWVGGIGALACWLAPGAARNLPMPMLAYVGVALLSAAVHQWPKVAGAAGSSWWLLFVPAWHLVIMLVLVFGAAFLLRTSKRLSVFIVLLVTAICVIAVQVLFDRTVTLVSYSRNGPQSLPSIIQWGGLHQAGLLFVLALPFPLSLVLVGGSMLQRVGGTLIAGALVWVALANDSTGGVLAMALVGAAMAGSVVVRRMRRKWLAGLAAAVAFALSTAFVVAVASGRVAGVRQGDLAGRVPIWRAAATLFRDHIWLGAGPGRYLEVMTGGGYQTRFLPPGQTEGVVQAHNMLLHTGAETGLAGMLFMAAIWLWMINACRRSWIKGTQALVAFGLMFALVGFFVRSMSDNFLDGLFTKDRTRVLIWTLFAAALALDRLARRPTQVEQ